MSKYYYNPAYPGLVKELKKLAFAAGEISGKLALEAAVSSGVNLTPEQKNVFEEYYGSDLGKLKARIEEQECKMKQAWTRFLAASDAAGIKRTRGKNSADYALYCRFYYSLRALEEDCDLRAKVHEWANADLKRIKNGRAVISPAPNLGKGWKELEMLSVPVIMARYERLLMRRDSK